MGEAPGAFVRSGPAQGPTPDACAVEVARQLGRLGHWLRGRLVLEPDESFVPAAHYFDPDVLRSVIDEFRAEPMANAGSAGGAKRRDMEIAIAVSRFARRYAGPFTAVALAGLAAGIGLDVSPERCLIGVRPGFHYSVALHVPAGTVVRCAERPTSVRADGPQVETVEELRRVVWSSLYGAHLGPMYALLHELTGGPESLMWASAAEYATMVSDDAEDGLPADESAPYVADRIALFDAEQLSGVPGPNPMRDAITWYPVDGYPFAHVATRRICCLSYLLAMRDGVLCGSCPYLPLADRAALVWEDQQPSSDDDDEIGPARRRAQQIGRQRPSFGRV